MTTPIYPKPNDLVKVKVEGETPFTALVEFASADSLLLIRSPGTEAFPLYGTVPGSWETRDCREAVVEIVAFG